MIIDPGGDAALQRPAGAACRPYLENFPWIKNVFRIERMFDFAHHPEQLTAELLAHVFSAGDAHTVLGGERTFELAHQRGGLIGDLSKFFQIGPAMEIENGPDVEQYAGGMAEIARLQAERFHDQL